MKEECIWCGYPCSTRDYLIYPGKGPVPEVEQNQVFCCRACRVIREGRSVASWLSDCRESGRSADPQRVYHLLRELNQSFRTSRTEKELRQLRRALDLQFNTPVKRKVALTAMFDRAGNRCIWCGRSLSSRHPDSSYEHLIPKSRNGTNHPDNLLPACLDCNNRRSNLSPAEWLEIIIGEGNQPRLDIIWESLVKITGPDHGIRMQRRSVEYLDELQVKLEGWQDQPYLPQDLRRPQVARPKQYRGRYRRSRRSRRPR